MRKAVRILAIMVAFMSILEQPCSRAQSARAQKDTAIGDNNVGFTVNLYLFDMKVYAKQILPAIYAFTNDSRTAPLIELLERARQLPIPDDSERVTVEDFALYEQILKDFQPSEKGDINALVNWGKTQRPIRDVVKTNIAPALVHFYCLVRKESQITKQNLSDKVFLTRLYTRSSWVQSLFTFEVPFEEGSLEIPIGESTEVLSRAQIERLLAEVQANGCLNETGECQQYDHLRDLLSTALTSENLSVVLSVE